MKGAGIRFWKMSGAGNDFIVLPAAPYSLPVDPTRFVRRLCRRGLSVGADGVLFVVPRTAQGGSSSSFASSPSLAEAEPAEGASGSRPDVVLVHYNADGGRSAFCGNGTRCAARFAVAMGLASSPLTLRTDAGDLRAEVEEDRVRIEVPAPTEPSARTLAVSDRSHEGWFTIAGVPHFVQCVEETESIDVKGVGAALRSHRDLAPEGANIDFVGPVSGGRRRIRTFERGVEGETLACGSGAIAAAAVLAQRGERSPIILTPASGIDLKVEFEPGADGGRAFRLTGEARIVFEGVLAADACLESEGR